MIIISLESIVILIFILFPVAVVQAEGAAADAVAAHDEGRHQELQLPGGLDAAGDGGGGEADGDHIP